MIVTKEAIDINGKQIQVLLKKCQMGSYGSELHQKAFENSYRMILIFDEYTKQLIGCGRMISDGCYQGAIYDVAVDPNFQGKGLGKIIIENLIDGLDEINIILYASPGKEEFYSKFDFQMGKTMMGRFTKAAQMREKGFIE